MLSIDEINKLEAENKKIYDFLRSLLKVIDSQKMVEEVKLKALKIKIERYFEKAHSK